jgi:hypothetical protein
MSPKVFKYLPYDKVENEPLFQSFKECGNPDDFFQLRCRSQQFGVGLTFKKINTPTFQKIKDILKEHYKNNESYSKNDATLLIKSCIFHYFPHEKIQEVIRGNDVMEDKRINRDNYKQTLKNRINVIRHITGIYNDFGYSLYHEFCPRKYVKKREEHRFSKYYW